jgi:predicted transposase/invertase (TIGR01784 family)
MESYEKIKLEPLSDSVFSYIFADKDLTVSMQELIDSVLTDAGDPLIGKVKSVQAQYSVQKRMVSTHGGRLDARVEAADGTLFDIEVQAYLEPAMNDRSWFYGSNLMSEEFLEGQTYNKVPKVRVINLLDFVLRRDHPDLLQPISLMYRKSPAPASDAFRIYNIELPKFRDTNPTLESVKNDPLLRWLYLLDEGYKSDHEMEVLSNMTEGMRAFAKRYQVSLNDPDLRRMYDYEMSAKRDQASREYNAEMKGRTDVIRGMLHNGIPVDVIYKCVDAPRADVDAIIAKIRAED